MLVFPTEAYSIPTTLEHPNLYTNNREFFDDNMYDTVALSTNEVSQNQWIDHPVTKLMFALFKHYFEDNDKRLIFEHRKITYSQDRISHTRENKAIPKEFNNDILANNISAFFGIKFVHIKRGSSIFETIDTFHKDLKMVSSSLQQDRNHKIRVYNDIQANGITIATSSFNWTLVRKVIALLPLLWWKDVKLPSEIEPILKEFGNGDPDTWEKLYTTWIEKEQILEKIMLKKLNDLLAQNTKTQKQNLRTELNRHQEDVENYLNNLRHIYREIESKTLRLTALINAPNESADELCDYILKHKYIANLDIRQHYINFTVTTPLFYFEPEALKVYYRKSTSYIRQHGERWAKLIDLIFLQDKYTMFTETSVALNFKDSTVRANRDNVRGTAIKQPHIMGYNCWGNNAPLIIKSLAEKDYIQALEQTIAATQNINFSDSIVIEHFMNDLVNMNQGTPFIQNNETEEMLNLNQIFKIMDEEGI